MALQQFLLGLLMLAGFASTAQAAPAVAEGRLEIVVEDHATFSRTRHFLHTANGRLEMKIKGSEPRWRSGAKLRVKGEQDGPLMYLSSTDVATATVTAVAPLPNTLGEHKLGVLMVNFSDDRTRPYSLAQVNDMVFSQVNGYVRENSFQKAWLAGNTFGWMELPIAKTCDGYAIEIAARQAAAGAGIDLAAFGRLVFVFPNNIACGWSGLANLGGTQPKIWLNGWLRVKTIAHELGHTFGLRHAHSQDCGSAALSTTCTVDEYGDTIDAMGGQAAGHYDAFNKEQLGWLGNATAPSAATPGVVATVAATGRYTLEAYSAAPGSQAKALKVPRGPDPATGAQRWYYIEYRQAVGADAVLADWPATNYVRGLVVRTGVDGDGNSGQLLDMTPNSSVDRDWDDAALPFGQSYTDSAAGVTLVALSGNGSIAQVDITLNTPANCTRAAPTLVVTGGQSPVPAGGSQSYSLTLSNRDSTGCGSSAFDLSAVVPSGWASTISTSRLTLTPGASGVANWAVSSPMGTPGGNYVLSARASNASASGFTGQGDAAFAVAANLIMAANTDKGQYQRGEVVAASAVVSSAGALLSGASVSFVFLRPDGSSSVKIASTDASGKARVSYRLGRKDVLGAWQLQSQMSTAGTSVSASSAFTVQ